jgi:hypothetical protein
MYYSSAWDPVWPGEMEQRMDMDDEVLWTRDGIEVALAPLIRTPDLTLIIICGKKRCNNTFKSASYEGLFYLDSELVTYCVIKICWSQIFPSTAYFGPTYGHTYLSVHSTRVPRNKGRRSSSIRIPFI